MSKRITARTWPLIPGLSLLACVVLLRSGVPDANPEGASLGNAARQGETTTALTAGPNDSPLGTYAGSRSCKQCHQRFYELWEPSHHGKAFQQFGPELAGSLTPQREPIEVDEVLYRFHTDGEHGWVTQDASSESKSYPVKYAIGGKNVYFFLTELERGKLQVLPVAFNVQTQTWYDMAEAGLRHFTEMEEEPYHWTEWPFTFNTACHSCHVSQFSNNYDLATRTYHTTWREPGINCETCHGPAAEHAEFCTTHPDVTAYEQLRIDTISQKRGFTPEQVNANCLICHTKGGPITASFTPGERYFDHYDLTTLEHPDFHPDGRDRGENYTYTTWMMSECVKSSDLDCMHCHTSSGRYRFSGEEANNACMPCHQDHVRQPTRHTKHNAGSRGNECVSCHMPTTQFAAMRRSDHSMRPPTPATAMLYGSPDACILCHDDQDAAWADKWVREWRERDYQRDDLERAALLAAARAGDWSSFSGMVQYIERPDRDPVHANSLVRLLYNCPDDRKWPTLISVVHNDPSPLVRASAATGLQGYFTPEGIAALLHAAQDEYRLVRIRAGGSLAALPSHAVPAGQSGVLAAALSEYEEAMQSRPDDASMHYNLGSFHQVRGQARKAMDSYETALHFRPDFYPALLNVATVYNQLGRNDKAFDSLHQAARVSPESEAVWLNLGMLHAEMGRMTDAERAFRRALELNPRSAQAAYNLCVIEGRRGSPECLTLGKLAYTLEPDNARYGYTYAYFLNQFGEARRAETVLRDVVDRNLDDASVYFLLADMLEQQGRGTEAEDVYRKGLENENLPDGARLQFRARIQ